MSEIEWKLSSFYIQHVDNGRLSISKTGKCSSISSEIIAITSKGLSDIVIVSDLQLKSHSKLLPENLIMQIIRLRLSYCNSNVITELRHLPTLASCLVRFRNILQLVLLLVVNY